MKWKKLGNLFCPSGKAEWMYSHAANPVADHLEGDVFRIYFSSRDKNNRSSVGWLDLDLSGRPRVLRVSQAPVLCPGVRGSFDDSGCSVGCVVHQGADTLLFYMGWNLGTTVPWRNSIGVARLIPDENRFERLSVAPIVDRCAVDPYTLSYPWVLHTQGQWHMWYGSHLHWGDASTDMFHVIKYATSRDAQEWRRSGNTVISPTSNEYAFARPCVVKDPDRFRMWYAYRGSAYRIGYAESLDGTSWNRCDDEVGIDTSEEGWDSESLEYPSVFDHRGQRYMLYCGNGYGRTGFGIAMLEQS